MESLLDGSIYSSVLECGGRRISESQPTENKSFPTSPERPITLIHSYVSLVLIESILFRFQSPVNIGPQACRTRTTRIYELHVYRDVRSELSFAGRTLYYLGKQDWKCMEE